MVDFPALLLSFNRELAGLKMIGIHNGAWDLKMDHFFGGEYDFIRNQGSHCEVFSKTIRKNSV